jgi:hypothetical protein
MNYKDYTDISEIVKRLDDLFCKQTKYIISPDQSKCKKCGRILDNACFYLKWQPERRRYNQIDTCKDCWDLMIARQGLSHTLTNMFGSNRRKELDNIIITDEMVKTKMILDRAKRKVNNYIDSI